MQQIKQIQTNHNLSEAWWEDSTDEISFDPDLAQAEVDLHNHTYSPLH